MNIINEFEEKSERYLLDDKKYYQWTCIDKASGEKFTYHYEEHIPAITVDFIYRCFLFYGYKPEEMQAYNGT